MLRLLIWISLATLAANEFEEFEAETLERLDSDIGSSKSMSLIVEAPSFL